jgi:hypothetical protein
MERKKRACDWFKSGATQADETLSMTRKKDNAKEELNTRSHFEALRLHGHHQVHGALGLDHAQAGRSAQRRRRKRLVEQS